MSFYYKSLFLLTLGTRQPSKAARQPLRQFDSNLFCYTWWVDGPSELTVAGHQCCKGNYWILTRNLCCSTRTNKQDWTAALWLVRQYCKAHSVCLVRLSRPSGRSRLVCLVYLLYSVSSIQSRLGCSVLSLSSVLSALSVWSVSSGRSCLVWLVCLIWPVSSVWSVSFRPSHLVSLVSSVSFGRSRLIGVVSPVSCVWSVSSRRQCKDIGKIGKKIHNPIGKFWPLHSMLCRANTFVRCR